jgi:hypothetical protein
MKKRIIWAALCLTALSACQRETEFQEISGTFTATTESSATRTSLSPNGDSFDVLWAKGDEITIVDAAGQVGVYATESTTSQGVFAPKSGQEAVTPDFKAYFPATLYNDGTPTLPAVQMYTENNIHTAPMYAESSTTALSFKNLCGIVRLKVSTTQEGKKVRKVSLSADKPLSGAFTILEDAAVVSGTAGISLDCGEDGVAIGAEAIPLFIALPAGTYNPLKITVITTDGEVQTRTSSTDIVISRSKVTTITLGFGDLSATAGSADVLGGGSQPWVQLWPGGPKWAKFNVGSTIDTYADVTDYTNPDVVGGYYSYRGYKDSTPNAYATDDTAATLWGDNWATPTQDQQKELLNNCTWTWCDGNTVQFEPGCTLVGWKVSGKEDGFQDNAIFLPLGGIRDQNSRNRQNVGDRGCFWSITDGSYYGAYYLHVRSNTREMSSHNTPHGCSVRAICVGDAPVVEGVFEVTAANFQRILLQFNEYTGENPQLIVTEDIPQSITITRPDGEIDLGGHTIGKLYLQNNELDKAVTVRNGTVAQGIDGKDGQSDYYAGTVILENVNTSIIWTDGHAYIINGGVIDEIQAKKNAATPGTVTILDGFFGDIYRYVDRYGGNDDGSAYIISGGKFKTRPPYSWCAGGHYAAANPDSDAETYPYTIVEGDPSENWFNGPATDLSAEATANTYMVHEAGTYKFKATVKGNGGFDPVTGVKATPIPVADISGVTVLWELKEAGLAIKIDDSLYEIGYKEGYVYFNTPDAFVPGAAYVAVFKDGEGGKAGRYDRDVDEILWSWLIWATEKPTAMPWEDLSVMDRNIGALNVDSDIYKIGFEYQWGRKDPFPGGGAYGRGTQLAFAPTKNDAFAKESFPTGTTIAYSIAHPTTVFGPWNYESWLCEEEFTPSLWSDTEKTIYDPCPAGWRIPSKDDLEVILAAGFTLPGAGGASPDGFFNAYCNGSTPYYWSSTGVSRTSAWSLIDRSITSNHYDLRMTTAMSIRPVKEERAEPVSPIPGSANTFMITEAGSFSFDATVKGNGARDPMTGVRATRIDKAKIAGVKVLWEVYDAGRAIRHDESGYAVSYADGRVTLTTSDPLISGAACVAVYDASETILWSWLIWTTPEPGIKEHNGKEFMDRNLGAVNAGNCMRGFLFEWGRKDGFSAANGGYQVYPYVPIAKEVFTHETGPKTMEESIAHPTVWYRGGGTYNYSWMPWDEFTMKPWRPWEKTIYDPCPEGWRIPTSAELRSISGMPNTGIGGGYDPNEYYQGFGNPGTGYYWSCSSDGGLDMRAYAFVNDGRNIQHWGHDQGYAIRCVRE